MADDTTQDTKPDEKPAGKIPDTATRAGRKAEAKGESKGESKPVKAEAKSDDKPKEKEKKAGEPREGRKMDDPMRVLARRAVEIAESGSSSLGSAVTAPQASLIKDRLGSDPMAKFKPATIGGLLAYAQGGRGAGRDQLDEEALKKLRDFCRQTGNRRIWPRKVAALVLALHEQATGRAIPGAKAKTVEPTASTKQQEAAKA